MPYTHAENKAHVESRLHARSPFHNGKILFSIVTYRAKIDVTGRSVRALVTLGRCLRKRAAVDVRSATTVQRSVERTQKGWEDP
jgi:hypothetical protein